MVLWPFWLASPSLTYDAWPLSASRKVVRLPSWCQRSDAPVSQSPSLLRVCRHRQRNYFRQGSALKPSQRHRLDVMIGALGEDQRRARPCRQDAFLEIGEICALPDRRCGGDRFIVRQQRITVEVGPWIVERGIAEGQKALHVPIAQDRHVRVDVNREVEKDGDDGHGLAVVRQRGGLQD